MRYIIRLICSAFLGIMFISSLAQAEWASPEDASIKIADEQVNININPDGTYEAVKERKIDILKDSGRSFASYSLYYNGDSQKIEILDAKTIYKGKEYKVDKGSIEDKPLASVPTGFDQFKQILVAFPKVEIGAKINLKYKLTATKAPIDGFFSDLFYFGNKEFVANSKMKIHSQIPLHILINDPTKVLKIIKDKDDGLHDLEIILTKPIFNAVINEPSSSIVNDKYLTWVSVSSLSKWENLSIAMGKSFSKVFTQILPKDFVAIITVAAQKKDEIEQINTVTSLLNDKVRYMGDWRSIKGRYTPRDLDVISKTQLGDCKDFAAVTAAMLTKLGFKAQVAAVRRGIREFYPSTLPDLFSFNHVLVKVIGKKGHIYWIDPTNFESMADGIFPDVAGKMALILDPKSPAYEKIPNIDTPHAQTLLERQIKILSGNSSLQDGRVTLKNEETLGITGAMLYASEKAVKNSLYYYLAGTNLKEAEKKKMELPDLKSRIVKDISVDYSFVQNGSILKTNVGQAIKLGYDLLDVFFAMSQDCVADIVVSTRGMTSTVKRQTIIKQVSANNIESLNKEIKTPWIYIKREGKFNQSHDLQINDTIIIYKNLIASEEFKTPEFIKLKQDLEENFKDVIVVFSKIDQVSKQ